ncbi:hypothetical protein HKD37_14G040109 [Glycine soja]|nr:hypothetical protein GYH30_039860 [Glycine max]
MTTKLGKGYGNVGGDCRLRWLKDYNGTVIRLDQRFGALWLWLELVAFSWFEVEVGTVGVMVMWWCPS